MIYSFRVYWWKEEQHLFELEIFCNVKHVFTVTFDQYNVYRLLISTKKNTVVYIIYNLLYSPFIIFKIWFWTSTRCQFLWERRWGRRSERLSLNSTTIRTRRNWLTGSPSYALSQILAGSSPNRTPWIRMVLLHTLQQMHYSVFPICLIILFNGVCLCVPVIITTQSPPQFLLLSLV